MNEEEIVSGALSVTKDGRALSLPVLKIKRAREWRKAVAAEFDGEEPENTSDAMNVPADKILDLVLAYDRTNVLGGRESIEDSMTDEELYDAFIAMWRKTFPFARLARDLMSAASPAPARLPNGRSPTGPLTPTA
jgi:hypothetical protein